MQFKLVYDHNTESLDIRGLSNNHQDIILPVNPFQDVYFPMPEKMNNKLQKILHERLIKLIPPEQNKEFIQMIKNPNTNREDRFDKIYDMRKIINPQIIEVCKKFRLDYPEEFI